MRPSWSSSWTASSTFADYDAERTKVLETRGVSVIRFSNAEVEGDLESVLTRISAALRAPFD